MRNLRRFFGWSAVLVLCLIPLVMYGVSPYVLTEFVEWKLKQLGFHNPDITIGYPDLHSLPIDHISLEKETPAGVMTVTIRKGVVTYQLSQLSVGHISHIYIPDATIHVIPSSTASGQDEAMAVTTQSALTLNAFIQPLPPLPFDKLTIDSLVIAHHESKSLLRELHVAGALQNNNGNARGKFTAKGLHTPEYEMVVQGENLGNMDLTLSVAGDSPTTVWNSHVEATPFDNVIQVVGSMNTDIQELNRFLSFMIPTSTDMKGVSGRMTIDWNGIGPKDTSLDALHQDAKTEISGTFQVQGKVPHLRQRVQDLEFDLDGTFTARPTEVNWALSPHASVTGLMDMKTVQVPEMVHTLTQAKELPFVVFVPKGLQGVLRKKKGRLAITVNETACVEVKPAASSLSGQLCLTDWHGRLESPVQAEGRYALSVKVPKARMKQVSFDHLSWNVQGKIVLQGPNVEVSLDPASDVEMIHPRLDAVTMPAVTLDVQEVIGLHYEKESASLTISSGVLNLKLPYLHWKGKKVSLDGATVALKTFHKDSSNWAAHGTVNIRGVSTTIGPQTPPATYWSIDFVLDPSQVFANIFARTDQRSIVAKARLTHSWKTNRGVLQAKVLPVTFSPSDFLLSQSLQPWTYPFDIASGKISALANIFWKTSSAPDHSPFILEPSEVEIGIRRLSGHFEKVMFQDVTTTLKMRGAQQWVTFKPASFTLQQLHSGIDITNISGQVHAAINPFSKAYRIQVKNFSFGLLGGTVQSREMVFDSTQPQQQLNLDVEGVQLEELLQLEQQEGLQGTGLIDGMIPMIIGDGGIKVDQGHLEARAPGGMIHYHSAEETLGSLSHLGPQMELVVDALENFKYDVLRTGVDYHEDGTLNLHMRLEGKNSELKRGRPIHVNFNLEENIPSLLKSLAVVKGIEKDIEHMLNRPLRNFSGN